MTDGTTGTDRVQQLMDEATQAAMKRRFDDSWSKLEELLVLDPEHLRALDLAGYVRFFQGKPQEAERFCRRALAIAPDHAYAHKGLGLCLARQGHVDDGVRSLKRAMELKPQWGDPYWDLAVVLAEAARLEEAIEVLQLGARLVPARRRDFETFEAKLARKRDAAMGDR